MPAVKPRVVVSRCLGFAACRWNGVSLPNAFVDKLAPLVEFVDVCPEFDIGLGAPRDPIRVVEADGGVRLVQPATGRDLTQTMRGHIAGLLDDLGEVDGFLLKHRSPTCGIKDVRRYAAADAKGAFGRGPGFLGGAVLERHPELAVEDEGRLNNYTLREHYLTKLFSLAELRGVIQKPSMAALMDFQARHKLLLLAYDQAGMRRLGRLLARAEDAEKAAAEYRRGFAVALTDPPGVGPVTNVLLHTLGYFSKQISASEKAFFLDLLTDYREAKLPLSALASVLRGWIIAHGVEYLTRQSFFEPFPRELVEITDSGKGRDH